MSKIPMFFDLNVEENEEALPEAKSDLKIFKFLEDKPQHNCDCDYEVLENAQI